MAVTRKVKVVVQGTKQREEGAGEGPSDHEVLGTEVHVWFGGSLVSQTQLSCRERPVRNLSNQPVALSWYKYKNTKHI